MNLAIFKLGAKWDLPESDATGAVGEVCTITKMISSFAEFDLFSTGHTINNIKTKSLLDDYRTLLSSKNLCKYDALIVINGKFAENSNDLNLYEYQDQLFSVFDIQRVQLNIIEQTKIPVIYILCDPALWPTPKNAPLWASPSKINKKINFIVQPYDIISVVNDIIGATNHLHVEHFPFYKFPLLNPPTKSKKVIDLIYGGNFRAGARSEKIKKWYLNHPSDISVEIFGRITQHDLNTDASNVEFSGPVQYNVVQAEFSKAIATVAIGDDWYNGRNLNQRIYESINAGVVTFIDNDLDPKHLVYANDPDLIKYLYVSTRDELYIKLLQLKSDKNFRNEILEKQSKSVAINEITYKMLFKNKIEKCLS